MTKDREFNDDLADIIDYIESKKTSHESELCSHLMYVLSRLDIGHDRVVRYWTANELYILLSQGKEALKEYREDNDWWG